MSSKSFLLYVTHAAALHRPDGKRLSTDPDGRPTPSTTKVLRHSESNGYLRAYCEKPGINAAGRTPRFWHGGGYVHDLTVREPGLPLLVHRIYGFGAPCRNLGTA